MVDIATIKNNYANMENFQLLQISKEASQLSMDAFIILKREIIKRGLDTTIICEQETIRVEQKIDRINRNIDTENKKFVRKIWNLALLKKSEGFTNDEIVQMLVAEEVHPESALNVIANLDEAANELLKDANNGVLGGLFLLGLGVAGIFVATSLNFSVLFFIYLIPAVLIRGLILLYTSSVNKTKLKDIISNIENETATDK